MAVNSSRSMNADLREGVTDGKYRKARPNTSLSPEYPMNAVRTAGERAGLHPFYGYGFINTEIPAAQRDDESYRG